MKFAFATCLVAATALAQDYYNEDSYYIEEQSSWTDKIPIEMNEDGNYELQLPEVEIPSIEFADVDTAKIAEWVERKTEEAEQWNSDFADAWRSYTDKVAQPWNDFVTNAEDLMIEARNMDAQSSEEVIQFVADNTFIDGKTLTEVFPHVNDFLAAIQTDADNFSERFNLDAIRATPLNLQSYYNDDYYNYYDDDYYYEDEPSRVEEAMEAISDAVISYGFDPELVEAWFETTGANWEELTQEQNEAKAEMAKADIAEAADYLKGIVDTAVTDIKSRVDEQQAEFEQQVDERAQELKSQADAAAQEAIDRITNWLEHAYSRVQEVTEQMEEPEVEELVVLAQKKTTKKVSQKSSGANYMGIAALSAGAIATVAFLYKKQQQQKQIEAERPVGIDEDEEFVLV